MEKQIKKKIDAAEEAADLYLEDPNFTLKSLAEKLQMKPAEMYGLFPNRRAILQFYYAAQIYKYRGITSQIEGFKEYTIAEKLSNLALTLTDLFLEHREFVEYTFHNLIANYYTNTAFDRMLEQEIKTYLENDPGISASASVFMKPFFFKLISMHYKWLIRYWLNDQSTGFENTMALTDKWTSFIQELLYLSIIDKGFDLAKFAFLQSGIKDWFTTGTASREPSGEERP